MKRWNWSLVLLLAVLLTACSVKETAETPAAQEPEAAVSAAEAEETAEPEAELLAAEAPDEETAEKRRADQEKAAKMRETAKERREALLQAQQEGDYVLCDTCGAIYEAGGTCWHCEGDHAALGLQCPGCGGYTGFTGEFHKDCPKCGETLCSLVLVDGIEYDKVHCEKCGACGLDTDINRYYWCDACTEIYGRKCPDCGALLQGYQELDQGYCEDCWTKRNAPRCMICGRQDSTVWEGYCSDCRPGAMFCAYCGADISFSDGYDIGGGQKICDRCYEAMNTPDEEEPNVSCPYCGYAFYTTGVGADGITCPSCGQQYQP